MPRSTKRIRVYGRPRPKFDPDLMVQVLIVLGRELGQKARPKADPPARPPTTEPSELPEDQS